MKISCRDTTCTISGLRPHKFPENLDLHKLSEELEKEIRRCIFRGYKIFQIGLAMGSDIMAGEIIIKLREEYPFVQLHCYQPCETQANGWPESWHERYFYLISCSDETYLLQKKYTGGCMQRRNKIMVGKSSLLIAIHDGETTGGTAGTIRYAQKIGVPVIIVNPNNYLIINNRKGKKQ